MNAKQAKSLRQLSRKHNKQSETVYDDAVVTRKLEWNGRLTSEGNREMVLVDKVRRRVSLNCERGVYRQIKRAYTKWAGL